MFDFLKVTLEDCTISCLFTILLRITLAARSCPYSELIPVTMNEERARA